MKRKAVNSGWPSFPLNVWQRIFEYLADNVYSDTLEEETCFKYADLDSDACFPYSVAATSPLFNAIIAQVPSAWRRVRVYLDEDDPATKLKQSLSRLTKANLHPSDILISRRGWKDLAMRRSSPGVGVPCDPLEELKMKEIMGILPQCLSDETRSLIIRTISGNSLPDIKDLQSEGESWPELVNLELDSLVRGTGRLLPSSRQDDPGDDFGMYSLSCLTVTGPNFVSLCRTEDWTTCHKYRQFHSLRVSHFDDIDGRETLKHPSPFTLRDAFSRIFELTCGRACIANFTCSKHEMDPTPEPPMSLPNIVLENVSQGTMESYLEYLASLEDRSPYDIDHEFIDCTFYPPAKWSIPISNFSLPGVGLQLTRISDPTTVELCLRLAADECTALWVTDSPGFTDANIRALVGQPQASTESSSSTGTARSSTKFRSLRLYECPHISLDALREVVDALNGLRDEEDDVHGYTESSEFGEEMVKWKAEILDPMRNEVDEFCDKMMASSVIESVDSPSGDQKTLVEKGVTVLAPDGGKENRDDDEDPGSDEGDNEDDVSSWSETDRLAEREEDDDDDAFSDGHTEAELEGPQIWMVEFSGASPCVSNDDIEWFQKRGVSLDVLPL